MMAGGVVMDISAVRDLKNYHGDGLYLAKIEYAIARHIIKMPIDAERGYCCGEVLEVAANTSAIAQKISFVILVALYERGVMLKEVAALSVEQVIEKTGDLIQFFIEEYMRGHGKPVTV
jgi:hypothetical protein